MKLRLAQDLTEKDPARAGALLEELQSDTGDALQAVRDLARGIHPPLLTDRGLLAALEAHARRCPIPVTVRGRDLSRYATNIEAAVYFCCLEAIQNAIKHSDASGVTIDIAEHHGELAFAITDDGAGFAPETVSASGLENMADRLAALKGTLEIRSAPGHGTTVTGWVPVARD
jgi:signal transduction histidine kinase